MEPNPAAMAQAPDSSVTLPSEGPAPLHAQSMSCAPAPERGRQPSSAAATSSNVNKQLESTPHRPMLQPSNSGVCQTPIQASPATRRQRMVLFVGYCGAGYYGFQRLGPKHPTIEAELHAALHRAGAVDGGNSTNFTRVGWKRAARTDRGVSAAGNVVSCDVPWRDGMIELINDHLPPLIRVFGAVPVAPAFDARHSCDSRRYEYLLPVWALDPQVGRSRATVAADEASTAAAAAALLLGTASTDPGVPSLAGGGAASTAGGDSGAAVPPASLPQPTGAKSTQQCSPGIERRPSHLRDHVVARVAAEIAGSQYEFTELERRKLNLILSVYQGCHNFHNFTNGVAADSDEAWRTMLSVQCPGTLRLGAGDGGGGALYVRIVLGGRSFMLHQIRKMVGLAVAVARKVAPPRCLRVALDPCVDVAVPVAPAAGLIMDEAVYSAYNEEHAAQYGALELGVMAAEAKLKTAAAVAAQATLAASSDFSAPAPAAVAIPTTQLLQGTSAASTMPPAAPPTHTEPVACTVPGAATSSAAAAAQSAGQRAALFKRDHIYPGVAAAGPDETMLFVRGLTDNAYGFSRWRPAAASAPAKRQATPPGRVESGAASGAAVLVAAQETYGQGRPPHTEKRARQAVGPPPVESANTAAGGDAPART